jgi:hypothetical protein
MRRRLSLLILLCHPLIASEEVVAPWQRNALDFETGIGWQVSSNTPVSYRLITTQLSWRTPYHLKFDLENRSTVVVRSNWTFMATFVDQGPESHFLSIAGSPSIEWWSPNDRWSLYLQIGGGAGVTDSAGGEGGQGQDFVFNWFAKSGLRYQCNDDLAFFGGAHFVHHSNKGATDPNPGIDSLGFTFGASFSF